VLRVKIERQKCMCLRVKIERQKYVKFKPFVCVESID
jgi:hypothetical protein